MAARAAVPSALLLDEHRSRLEKMQSVPLLDKYRERLDEFGARHVLADSSRDPKARIAAVRRLRKAGGYVLQDLLAVVKKDPNEEVRVAAVHAAGAIVALENRPCPWELIEALTDGSPEIRRVTALYIQFVENVPRDRLPMFLKAIEHEDRDARSAAARAIGYAGVESESVLKVLKRATRDRDWRVRLNAAIALWRLTRSAELVVPVQLAVAGDWEVEEIEEVRWALAGLIADKAAESEAVFTQVVAAFTGTSRKARAGAGTVMAAILLGDKAALKEKTPRLRELLRRLVKEGDEETRKVAAKLLELHKTAPETRDDNPPATPPESQRDPP